MTISEVKTIDLSHEIKFSMWYLCVNRYPILFSLLLRSLILTNKFHGSIKTHETRLWWSGNWEKNDWKRIISKIQESRRIFGGSKHLSGGMNSEVWILLSIHRLQQERRSAKLLKLLRSTNSQDLPIPVQQKVERGEKMRYVRNNSSSKRWIDLRAPFL